MKNIFSTFKQKIKFDWIKFFIVLSIFNLVLTISCFAFTIYSNYMSSESQIKWMAGTHRLISLNSDHIRCLETGGNINAENPQCIYAKMTAKSGNCQYDKDGKIDETYWDKNAIKECKESQELSKKLEKLYGENWFEKVFENTKNH